MYLTENSQSPILDTCNNLSIKLYEAHDSLAFLSYAVSEILEHGSSLNRDEQNGLTIHFNKILDKLKSCDASLDLIYAHLRAEEANRREKDEQ